MQGLTDIAWKDTTCSRATFGLIIGKVTVTINWRPICKQEQTTTSESMDALSDVFDFLMENAPVAAAVGGVAASTALVANPSLPMTGSNGVPPGVYVYFLLSYISTFQVSNKRAELVKFFINYIWKG